MVEGLKEGEGRIKGKVKGERGEERVKGKKGWEG